MVKHSALQSTTAREQIHRRLIAPVARRRSPRRGEDAHRETATTPSVAVAATACCRVNKLVSNRSSMEAAKDCVPTSGRKEPLAVQGDSYTPSTRH